MKENKKNFLENQKIFLQNRSGKSILFRESFGEGDSGFNFETGGSFSVSEKKGENYEKRKQDSGRHL